MDVIGGALLYDESTARICLAYRSLGEFDMNIEKRNSKMFNVITLVVLAAILLTVLGGFMMQRQILPARDGGMGMGRSTNPMQPESAQTGPIGRLVMSTGVLLLLVGFGVLVVMLWVWRSRVHQNPS
jgi:hypothetical protein